MSHTIALFGEAEKGEYRTAYFFRNLAQLEEHLGSPPPNSQGLLYAIQALLYNHQLIFFRVEEEGFSTQDYIQGLRFLENKRLISSLEALFMPGVGDKKIIDASMPICSYYDSLLVMTETDLYDFLTCRPA